MVAPCRVMSVSLAACGLGAVWSGAAVAVRQFCAARRRRREVAAAAGAGCGRGSRSRSTGKLTWPLRSP
jgi:hypothetical protein